MTRTFNDIKEAKEYFGNYNFSNWLTNTFEINVNENDIKKISFSLQGGVVWINKTDNLGYCRPIGTYGVEDVYSLLLVLKEAIYDPYN